jgi:Leucine-rich repeat (LRR) protein
LSNNKIITLDEKINELKNLKVIDLTGNSLSDLPQQILELTNLQVKFK